MSFRRGMRFASVGLLAFGLFALVAADSIVAASKAEEAKKYTEQLKSSKDAKKKAEALEELGKLGQIMKSLVTSAIPDIKKSLDDKEASVRKAAAVAYGKVDPDPKEAVPALVKLLKDDKDEGVKIAAANGLAAMGDKARDAIPDLRAVQKSEDKKSKLAKAAQDAMRSINPKKK
jgi:HEAT repeat protein